MIRGRDATHGPRWRGMTIDCGPTEASGKVDMKFLAEFTLFGDPRPRSPGSVLGERSCSADFGIRLDYEASTDGLAGWNVGTFGDVVCCKWYYTFVGSDPGTAKSDYYYLQGQMMKYYYCSWEWNGCLKAQASTEPDMLPKWKYAPATSSY